MSEKIILVCDVCGEPAAQTVGIRIAQRNLSKDLCKIHLQELIKGTRPARRGRRKAPALLADNNKKAASESAAPRARTRTARSRKKTDNAV